MTSLNKHAGIKCIINSYYINFHQAAVYTALDAKVLQQKQTQSPCQMPLSFFLTATSDQLQHLPGAQANVCAQNSKTSSTNPQGATVETKAHLEVRNRYVLPFHFSTSNQHSSIAPALPCIETLTYYRGRRWRCGRRRSRTGA